uniref:Caffeoyl-CoA O-methyltransferase n=1 Tax=Acrobeloides nanus TaxID=290746 RepID=A0A914DQ15_9BILA
MASNEEPPPRNRFLYRPNDPLVQYCANLTTKFESIEKELHEATIQSSHGHLMLGAPEILQFGKYFIQLIGAKRVLDIGTYTGASALAWALALPIDGEVVSMDIDHTDLNAIGKPIINRMPEIANKIKFELGSALDTLEQLLEKGQAGKFDFAFIDADKINYPNYYKKCIQLLRSGGVIFFDNALWGGSVVHNPKHDDDTRAIVACNELIFNDPNSNSTLVNMGDGLHIVFKK